jgi:hypothetical protein
MWKSQGGTWLKALLQQTGMLLTFFVVRLGGGYLLAGPSGLSFFGPQYTAALDRFVGDSPETTGPTQPVAPAPEATGNQDPTSQAELVQRPTVGEDFLEVFAAQVFGQYAFLILLAGIPLFLGLRALKTVLVSSKPVGQQSAFVVLVALLGAVMIPAIAAFQGIAATFGESTDQAVISRHYDFLIPLFLLAGFSISKFVEPSKKSRTIQAAIVALAGVYSLIWLLNFVSPRASDSSTVTGLLFSPVVFYLLVAIVLATVTLWAAQPAKTSVFVAKALIPLIFVSVGLLSQVSLHQYEGVEKADFDLAGEAAKPILKGVPGEQIVVVGVSRPALFTAKFWIDIPGVADSWVTSEDTEISNIVSPYSYALVLGTFIVNTPNEVLAQGSGYQLLRIQK